MEEELFTSKINIDYVARSMYDELKKKYDALLEKKKADDEDLRFLDCLRSAGVDNWDGYEYAQELMGEDD